MTEKRFTVKQRQGATIYSIEDYYGELPLNEGIYYKSNADKLCEWLNTQHELLNTLYNENGELKQRNKRLEEKIQRERRASTKQHLKWSKEAENKIKKLADENEQLKKVLGAILLEVKRDISNTNQTGEIRVFINPDSFNLISEVLRKYGALKEWYE